MNHSPEFGTLAWGVETGGRLTKAERRRVRRGVLNDTARYARSRLLLLAGRGSRPGRSPMRVLDVPDTALSASVDAAARGHQSLAMYRHGIRSVAFAHAIADIDGIDVDDELLWCGCVLHDVALEAPEPGRCFAVRGGEIAKQAALDGGASTEVADLLGDTIAHHATADLDPARLPLPYLVAGGALVDVLGKRLDEMDPTFVREVLEAQPRDGFATALAVAWKNEARAVPDGRAAIAQKTVCFNLAAKYCPLG